MEKIVKEHKISSVTRNTCTTIHPELIPFVEHCILSTELNTQGGILEISSPNTSVFNNDGERACDRFTVAIPYCGAQVSWEVIFDRNNLTVPPDIIFSVEDDQMAFDPDIEKLTSLSKWEKPSPRLLSALLEELLTEYKVHHRSIASQHQRINFELSTLLESNCFYNVDVHCTKYTDNHYNEPVVRFYIQLPVDFSSIPAYLTKNNPGTNEAALMVTFSPPFGSRVVPSLFLSPRVERMLGGCGQLRLPSWGGDRGSYIIDYVSTVQKLLEDKVQSIVQRYVRRKECVAAFLSVFGQSVLEYDTDDFNSIAFLFELQGFSFIVKFVFTDKFPQEKPILFLQSVYHRLHGKPCQSEINDYPYSPRWGTDELVERMRDYIGSIAIDFMELSKTKGEYL